MKPLVLQFPGLTAEARIGDRLNQADLEWEWKEVIGGLDALHQSKPISKGRRFLFRSQFTEHAPKPSGTRRRRGDTAIRF